jgi:hypothetical protein
MAHPYEAGLETFLDARRMSVRVRKPKGTGGRTRSTSSRPSSAGTARLEPARRTPPLVDRRRRRRVPVAVRRQSGRAPRVLSAASAYAEDPPAGSRSRCRRSRICSRAARCWPELPGRHEPGPGAHPGRHAEARLPARVLQRIPQITAAPERSGATCCSSATSTTRSPPSAKTDPTGDERTFALSRQARLIPIVATQSISSLRSALPGDESWRTLLQCFRTKVFLATSDEFTAGTRRSCAAGAIGSRRTTAVGVRPGRAHLAPDRTAAAPKQSLSASKSYAPHHEYIFAPRVFTSSRTRRPSRCRTTASTRCRRSTAT